MRVFLGIFPPAEVVNDFRSFKQQLKKQKQNLRFVPAPDVHLSVKFLGTNVSQASAELVKDVIGNVLKTEKPDLLLVQGLPVSVRQRLYHLEAIG